jgi:hypothetical protein
MTIRHARTVGRRAGREWQSRRPFRASWRAAAPSRARHRELQGLDLQALDLELAHVVGDEPFVATDDPLEIAHARALAIAQHERDRQARRIAQRLGARRPGLPPLGGRQRRAQALGLGRSRHSSSHVSRSAVTTCTMAFIRMSVRRLLRAVRPQG